MELAWPKPAKRRRVSVILYPVFVLINALDAYRSANGIKGANGPDRGGST